MKIEDAGVREAQRLADVADVAWRAHTGRGSLADAPCTQCSIASQRRGGLDALCPAGLRLHRERRDAVAELARERKDAARPNPAQAPLFDLAPAK